jgi:hypothetical protein
VAARREDYPAGYRSGSPGTGDFQLVLAPLHVDGAALRVVAVDKRVGERLAERRLGIGGDRYAEQPELQLFLSVPGLERLNISSASRSSG